MKKVKTSEWVPIDDEGRYWVYYKPGFKGNRNAYGYTRAYYFSLFPGLYRVETMKGGYTFTSMASAACYLKMIPK